MAVTTDDIAARLGRSLSTAEVAQIALWIQDAVALIEMRATRLGVDASSLDRRVVERVVALAVTAQARRPDDSTQLDVAVDDARVTKRWSSSTGQVSILDEWWGWLGLASAGGAFSTRPGFVPDGAGTAGPHPIAGAVDVIPPEVWP